MVFTFRLPQRALYTLLLLFVLGHIHALAPPILVYGSGTKEDPYQIYDALDLAIVENYSGSYFIQMNDIDLEGYGNQMEGWYPVGNFYEPIEIHYNGNGFAIKNLYIHDPTLKETGLFANLANSTFENINIENCNITGGDFTGALFGQGQADIINCSVTGRIEGENNCGGLVGSLLSGSTVFSSYSDVTIKSERDDFFFPDTRNIGGLIGNIEESCEIRACFAKGSITGDSYTGGFAGSIGSSTTIRNCYSQTEILGKYYLGGFAGYSEAGDLVDTIYSASTINDVGAKHGLIFQGDFGSNCYYDSTLIGLADETIETDLSIAEMKNQSTYENWDFSDIWDIHPQKNGGYPFLQWQNLSITPFPAGNGTEADPYHITTVTEVDSIRHYLDKYFILMNDLDFAGTVYDSINSVEHKGWEPIGADYPEYFIGGFNGQNYTIRNLYINRPETENVGLWGQTSSSTIDSVRLLNVNVKGGSYTGSLAGKNGGSSSNCHSSGSVSGSYRTGGLIGFYGGEKLTESSFRGSVYGNNTVGGLVGSISQTSKIFQCYTNCSVFGTSSVGGLLGEGAINAYVNSCFTAGHVHASENYVGGITGKENGLNGTSNCFSFSSIFSTYTSGYISGQESSGWSSTRMTNCYSVGKIEALYGIPGLIGSGYENAQITNSYTLNIGSEDSINTVLKSQAELQTESTFEGWDFTDVWTITEGQTFPYLQGLPQPPAVIVDVKKTAKVGLAYKDTVLVYTPIGETVTLSLIDAPAGMTISEEGIINWTPSQAEKYDSIMVHAESSNGFVYNLPFSVAANDLTGSGTEEDPFLISDYEELQQMGNYLSGHFLFTNDIDASPSETEPFTPIGNYPSIFQGYINGDGHIISNLNINQTDKITTGLIGSTDTLLIENLGIINSSITGDKQTGGIVGYGDRTSIKNCFFQGEINGNRDVGALAGRLWTNSSIEQSYASVVVNAGYYAGGLVGRIKGSVKNCYVSGRIHAMERVGGITYMTDEIENCYSVVDIISSNDTDPITANKPELPIDCYYVIGKSTGSETSAVGLTVDQLKTSAQFSNWDFNTIWEISEGESFPRLQNCYDLPIAVLDKTYSVKTGQKDSATVYIIPMDSPITSSEFTQELQGVELNGDIVLWPVFETQEAGEYPFSLTITDANNYSSITSSNLNIFSFEGEGTVSSPFQITNYAELNQIYLHPDAHYLVMNDIDASASETTPFNVIGSRAIPFSGKLDGQGFTINGLTIDSVGMFDRIDGALFTDLNFTNHTVLSANDAAGGLVNEVYNATFIRCSISGTVSGEVAGGLIQACKNSHFTDCHFTGEVEITSTDMYPSGGGLVANCHESTVTLCSSQGSLTSKFGKGNIGGLIGYASSSLIHYCHSSVNVKNGYRAGGLIGFHFDENYVRNCYATGDVGGSYESGGFISQNDGRSVIENCYSTGNVTGETYTGGFIGANHYYGNTYNSYCTGASPSSVSEEAGGFAGMKSGSLRNTYYNYETTPHYDELNENPRSTQQLKTQGTFENWDFENTWGLDPQINNGYPYLKPKPVFAGGSGTVDDPYQITTVQELDSVRHFMDDHFILMNDLDFAGTEYDSLRTAKGWEPIGQNDRNKHFYGSLNGQGYAIKNLYINRPDESDVGLFGSGLYARFDSIHLIDCMIKGSRKTGGIVAHSSISPISNSSVTGTISGNSDVGGIVGYISYNFEEDLPYLISNCSVNGLIEGERNVGGLVGFTVGSTIENVSFQGTVQGGDNVGGIIGSCNSTLTNSSSYAFVEGRYNLGGIAGYLDGEISHSYATGSVSGEHSCGGIVGLFDKGSIYKCYAGGTIMAQKNAGGLIGAIDYSLGPLCSNSYSSVTIRGESNCGGIAGEKRTLKIINCFASGTVVGKENSATSTVKSDTDDTYFNGLYFYASEVDTLASGTFASLQAMQTESTFQNWNFDTIWNISEGQTFPYLFELDNAPAILWDIDETVYSEEVYKDTVKTIDMASGNVSFRKLSGPSGLTINAEGVIEWQTPEIGNHDVSLEITGNNGIPVIQLFTLNVTSIPGEGTEATPYIITTYEQLEQVKYDLDAHYLLGNDIDASVSSGQPLGFEPIGIYGEPFSGTFDGQGFSITDLSIQRPEADSVALFGSVANATIKNLHLKNINISGHIRTAALALIDRNGTIENCSVQGDIIAEGFVTGMCISNNESNISNCHFTGSVTATGTNAYAAGLTAGFTSGNITNCSVNGNISAPLGIAYGFSTWSMYNIKDSYVKADVTGLKAYGFMMGGQVETSYFKGTVTGTATAIGFGSSSATDCFAQGTVIGGKIASGFSNEINATLENCYSLCKVSSDSLAAGFHHYEHTGTTVENPLVNCYFSSDSTAPTAFERATAYTSEELTQASTYHNWNFDSIWAIHPSANGGYPFLRWQNMEIQPFAGGSGTEDDPYQITTIQELDSVRHYLDKHFILMNDLDFAGTEYDSLRSKNGWEPIGDMANRFVGTFDGQEYSISNLFINSDSVIVGFFGYTGTNNSDTICEIKNLSVLDANIYGNYYAGILAGSMKRSHVNNCHTSGTVRSTYGCGGFASFVGEDSEIQNCSSDSYVQSFNGYAGGFISRCNTASTISNCVSIGKVVGGQSSDHYSGGFIGEANSSKIESCYSSAYVSGYYAGGFIGRNLESNILYCYSTGNIYARNAGGFSLQNSGDISNSYTVSSILEASKIGGFSYNVRSFYSGYGEAKNCYSYVWSQKNDSLTSFVENYLDCTFSDNYYAGYDQSVDTIPGVAYLPKDAFTQASSFSGWDFINIWNITEDATFPRINSVPNGAAVLSHPKRTINLGEKFEYKPVIQIMDAPVVSYVLENAPDGMTISSDGTVTWTPVTIGKTDVILMRITDANGTVSIHGFYLVVNGFKGEGTEDAPYQIYTYDDLNEVRNQPDASYILMNDINASQSKNTTDGFKPIGNSISAFTGTFNGNGFVIDSLYISLQGSNFEMGGLFGLVTQAEIHKLGVTNCNSSGYCYNGCLAGYLYESTITECFSSGKTVGDGEHSSYSGGLAGYIRYSTISNCYSTCIIENEKYAGSLFGRVTNSTVTHSYTSGAVTANTNRGGITGSYTEIILESCFYDSTYNHADPDTLCPGLSTAEMQNPGTYKDWDFGNVWYIEEGIDYPKLRAFGSPQNKAPVITSTAPREATEDEKWQYIINIKDSDSDLFTYELTNAPEGMLISEGIAVWVPEEGVLTSGVVTIKVTDEGNLSDSVTFTINVTPVNDAPVITSTAPTDATEDVEWRYEIKIEDPDSDSFTYEFLNAPKGMYMSQDTVLWVPREGVLTSGDVTIKVTDEGDLSDSVTFTINVTPLNDAPEIIPTVPTQATEDEEWKYEITVADPDSESLRFSLESAPQGMSISGGIATWVPGEGVLTSGEVTIKVTDEGNLSDSVTFTITVNPVNDAPVITSTALSEATEDVEWKYIISVEDPDSDSFTYEFLNAPKGMYMSQDTVLWVPREGVLTSGEVTIKVTDEGDLSDSVTFTITVNPVNDAPVITSTVPTQATENEEWRYEIIVEDPDSDSESLRFSLENAPDGMVISDGIAVWTPAEGVLTSGEVTIKVTDEGNLSDFVTFTITVNPVNDAPVITSTASTEATEDVEWSYEITVVDPDSDSESLRYSLENAPQGMSISGGIATWVPNSESDTTTQVSITVTDNEGLSVTQEFEITVKFKETPQEPKEETEIDFDVILYPNPASEWAEIHFSEPLSTRTRIEIIDASGKIMRTDFAIAGTKFITYDLALFSSGIYQIQVITQSEKKSIMMVVMNPEE